MMKKKLCVMAVMLTLATSFALPVSAISNSSYAMSTTITDAENEVTYFEDGSYLVTTLAKEITPISRAVDQMVFTKTATAYDSSNKARCALTVVGAFEVNKGVSVKCVGVKTETAVYQSGWSVENISTSRNNSSTTKASATASGQFVHRVAGIVTEKLPVSVTVSCDKNGNAS